MNSKHIAWNGISFDIPANWELALYKFLKRGVCRAEIEDEYSVRMEVEWVQPKRRLQMQTILANYEKRSKKLTQRADLKKNLVNLPPGWTATHYTLSETVPSPKKKGPKIVKHDLVTAFFLSGDSKLFVFVMLNFLPEDKEKPAEVMQLVASKFRHHYDAPLIPWELFDISFSVPPDFLLENTQFDVGSKLMTFRWKRRRFHLWHLSCADMFLKPGMSIDRWLAGYLNDFRILRGGVFIVDKSGHVRRRRHRRHIIAHRDEIARWCFKYEIRWRLDQERNQLIAWVFHYRKRSDLDVIPEKLRFERPAETPAPAQT